MISVVTVMISVVIVMISVAIIAIVVFSTVPQAVLAGYTFLHEGTCLCSGIHLSRNRFMF